MSTDAKKKLSLLAERARQRGLAIKKPQGEETRKYWYKTLNQLLSRELRSPCVFKYYRRRKMVKRHFDQVFLSMTNHERWHMSVQSVRFHIAPFEEQVSFYDYLLRLCENYGLAEEQKALLKHFETYLDESRKHPTYINNPVEAAHAMKRIRNRHELQDQRTTLFATSKICEE